MIYNRCNMSKRLFPLLLIACLIPLLISCAASAKGCTSEELSVYFDQSNIVVEKLNEYSTQATNHPDQKAGIVQDMKSAVSDFNQIEPPKCAREYKKYFDDAANASIATTINKDTYYTLSQLAQIAYDKWELVNFEKNRLNAELAQQKD